MNDKLQPKMNRARLDAILESYGRDPAHWPEAEREAALALIAIDSDVAESLQNSLEGARDLDMALDSVVAPAPSPDLIAQLDAVSLRSERNPLVEPVQVRQSFWVSFRRPAIFAGSGVAGALAGIALANAVTLGDEITSFDLSLMAYGSIDPQIAEIFEE